MWRGSTEIASSTESRHRWLAMLVAVSLIVTFGLHAAASAHPEGGGKADAAAALEQMGNEGADPASSEGVRLLGHADPGGFNADVVAHRNHAYMGSWGTFGMCPSQGVRVFDLHDPSNPTHVATFADADSEPDLAGTWTEKVIVERFQGRDIAAVSIQNCVAGDQIMRGWGLWDVTDPADPQRLSLVFTDERDRGSHEIWFERRGNELYVYTAVILSEWLTRADDDTPGAPDFQTWDVSDPTSPEMVGDWGAWAELGVHPLDGQGTAPVNFVHSVIGAVVGNQHLVYLSYWDLGTVILDVTDLSAPEFVGRTEFAPDQEGNAHSAWLARGGNVLIEAIEDFVPAPVAGLEQAWGYTRIFDVSDPADPVELSTFEMPSTRQVPPPGPGFFSVHDPKVQGSTLYLSYYAEGVVMVDISDPSNPTRFAQFVPDPSVDPFGVFFPGQAFPNVWGVFADRNYVLASDINNGLWVFELDRRGGRR